MNRISLCLQAKNPRQPRFFHRKIQRMPTLFSTQQAKQFLIREIVTQAARDGIPLTDIERDMLYFSETASILPGMPRISAEFDRGLRSE